MKHFVKVPMLVLTLTLSPVAFAHETSDPHKAMQSSPDALKAPFDVQFLDTMAEHHRKGIQMFKMAVDKAQSQELRDKARQMIADQEAEIPELKAMSDRIQPNAPEAINMNLPGMMPMDMEKLESSSGKDFDRHFIAMTIKHHQGAVEMSRDALQHSQNKRVRDKAQEMIDKQSKEIVEMQQMLEAMK